MKKYTVTEWITLVRKETHKRPFLMCQISSDLWENRRINSAMEDNKIYKVGVTRDPTGKVANVWSFNPADTMKDFIPITTLPRGVSAWIEKVKGYVGCKRFTSSDLLPELRSRGYVAHASRLGLIRQVDVLFHNKGSSRVWVIV